MIMMIMTAVNLYTADCKLLRVATYVIKYSSILFLFFSAQNKPCITDAISCHCAVASSHNWK